MMGTGILQLLAQAVDRVFCMDLMVDMLLFPTDYQY